MPMKRTHSTCPSRSSSGSAGSILVVTCLLMFVVAAFSVTVADQFLKTSSRTVDNGQMLRQVQDAILGDPSRERFGYLGDVGDYPATLADLLENPGGTTVGWNGPYLTNISLQGDMILDPYAAPIEFFLDVTPAAEHKMALISRGPDNSSTNTAANPNAHAQFAGVLPSNAAYASGAGNADNVGSRDFVTNVNSLDYESTGRLEIRVLIRELWGTNAGITEACPGRYDIEIQSATRGASDRLFLRADRTSFDLLQGVWDFSVTSTAITQSLTLTEGYKGQIVVRPGESASYDVVLTRTDNDDMPSDNLTVTNNFSETITMTRNDQTFQGNFNVNAGQTGTDTNNNNHSCVRVAARTGGSSGPIQHEWLWPHGVDQSVVVDDLSHTLTVENLKGGDRHLIVWIHGPTLAEANPIGTVYERGSRGFSIPAGNTIWITDGVGTQLDTFVLNAPQTKTY